MGLILQGRGYAGGPSEDWDAAPQFVKSGLLKLGLKRGVRTKRERQCGITLWFSAVFA